MLTEATTTLPVTPVSCRCNQCAACRYVDATRKVVLAKQRPAGPGIEQTDVEMWNAVLAENPCQSPLVIVTLYDPPAIVKGKVKAQAADEDGRLCVQTLEYGEVYVAPSQIKAWTPAAALEGIGYTTLEASLRELPTTWYPSLLTVLTEAAHAKQVFSPTGASSIVRQTEQRILAEKLTTDQTSGFVQLRTQMHAEQLVLLVEKLIDWYDRDKSYGVAAAIADIKQLLRRVKTGQYNT